MLVLSRCDNQRIILSNGVIITVVESRKGKARLGIDAPSDVSIVREEIFDGEFKSRSGVRVCKESGSDDTPML
jgi:carbon storage regulator CsrA